MKQKSFTFTLFFAVLVITSTSYAWGGFCGYSQEDSDRFHTYGGYASSCPGYQGYAGWGRRSGGMEYGYNNGMKQANHGMGMYSWLTTEQQNKLNTLRQQFINTTASARTQLFEKQRKLRAEMTASSPDRNKIKLLVKKISGLQETLMEKRINFRLDARKIVPFLSSGNHNRGYYGRMHNGMRGTF